MSKPMTDIERDTQRRDMAQQMKADLADDHRAKFPDGCPDWCDACKTRLMCEHGIHEWPRGYSDGDTCYCGAFYLSANDVDSRPRITEAHCGLTEAR